MVYDNQKISNNLDALPYMTASKIPRFYRRRYHPVDFKQKLVYLDSHPTAAACELRRGCEARTGQELTDRWDTYRRDGFTAVDPPIPKGSEDLRLSRYYPIDDQQKLIYLDTFPKAQDCEVYPGCNGMPGSEVRLRWKRLVKAGYTTVEKQSPETRGGAGRGQGALPQGLEPTAKLRVPDQLHKAVTGLAGQLPQRQVVSNLLDRVKAAGLVEFLAAPVTGGAKQLVLNQSDFTRLDKLILQLKKKTPLPITRSSVLAAIVLAEKSKRRKK
jgi:hypothetical protein